MSLKIEGRKCVVCQSYLFDDDDIVFCPECGAPHHRDCYDAVGHCNLEHLHGTAEQYRAEDEAKNEEEDVQTANWEKRLCYRCGREITQQNAQFCPFCSAPVQNIPFNLDPQINLGLNDELEDGVSAKEAAQMVAMNTVRYIPKFKKLSKGKKVSWNWAAFLLPHGWFAFRKMYLISALVAALSIAASIMSLPAGEAIEHIVTDNLVGIELMQALTNGLLNAGPIAIAFAAASGLLNLAVRIFSALFADYAYKKRVIENCKILKQSEEDKEYELRRLGGVNILAFFIVIMASNLLVNFLVVII